MTDTEVLNIYTSLVPFLGEVLGPDTEVIVHDANNIDHSIIAICHAISGRKIGDPCTDFARDLIKEGAYKNNDHLLHYKGSSKGKDFLSSTYFIKNNGRLIGLLCTNKDMSSVHNINNAIRSLMEGFNLAIPSESGYSENLESPVTAMINSRIAGIISNCDSVPSRMSISEKVAVVKKLNNEGILMIKGAVPEIANQLGVSVPTVYRYLNKCEKK